MNISKLIKSSLLLTLLTCGNANMALAKDGKGSDGGADKVMFDLNLDQDLEALGPKLIAEALKARIELEAKFLKEKVESGEVKKDLLALVQDPDFVESITNPSAKAALEKMLQEGLVNDINTPNKYVVKPKCADSNKVPKFLSTTIGDRNAEICVSPTKFYEDYFKNKNPFVVIGTAPNLKVLPGTSYASYPKWQILALFLHDHARQFGLVTDDNHSFASAWAIAMYSYPKFETISETSYKEASRSERHRRYKTIVVVSGIWRGGDLNVTVEVPKESRCGEVSDRYREVLGGKSNALTQTFPIGPNLGTFQLNCSDNVPVVWSAFGIKEAKVTIRTKTGRLITDFNAKGGYYYGSGTVTVIPNPVRINGEIMQ